MESRQTLIEEAWRNERKVNNLRSSFCFVIAVVGATAQTYALGKPHWATLFAFTWGVIVLVVNRTWFAKRYRPEVPWILSTIEIVMIGVALISARAFVLASRPDLADRQIGLLAVGLTVVVSLNMLRFSRGLPIFCTGLAIAVLVGVHTFLGTINPLIVPEILMLIAVGALLVYTTTRFGALLQRLTVDLRRIQRERIGSLRSLVAGVCHELNNPLGVLASNAQVSARSVEVLRSALAEPAFAAALAASPKVERALTALESTSRGTKEATDRIGRTVGSLEGFARLDEAEEKTVDLRQGIEDALALLGPRLAKIEVVRDLSGAMRVTCRPGEINQVFMHLLDNAAKAMPDGGTIRIGSRSEGGEVAVRISDTGKGIDREALDQIFEPTFAASAGRVKMGFGLSACQSIVHDHRGTIRIDSELGKGTTVEVRLPALIEERP